MNSSTMRLLVCYAMLRVVGGGGMGVGAEGHNEIVGVLCSSFFLLFFGCFFLGG